MCILYKDPIQGYVRNLRAGEYIGFQGHDHLASYQWPIWYEIAQIDALAHVPAVLKEAGLIAGD